MGKYIYLNELDSVNISAKEFVVAENRLYNEIYNGRRIVLTFNQLADSAFFMNWIQNKEMEKVLYFLIDKQWIVISPYSGHNSCVEYVLRNLTYTIDDYRKNGNDASEFLLSSLPFLASYPTSLRITIFEVMRDALMYSDVKRIEKLILDPKIDQWESKQIQDYIRFLLRINISDICYMPMQKRVKTFGQCVDEINAEGRFLTDSMRASFYEMAKKYSDRSTLLLDLQEATALSSEVKDEIELAVNLAYNLTVADNIVVEDDNLRTVPDNDARPIIKSLAEFRKRYADNEHDYIHRRKSQVRLQRDSSETYDIRKSADKWIALRAKLDACECEGWESVKKMKEYDDEILRARPNQSFYTNIETMVDSQFQQGTVNSNQTFKKISEDVDFEKAQKTVDQILSCRQLFDQQFGEQSGELVKALEEATAAIEDKNSGLLKKAWASIRSIAENAAGSLVASGILAAIERV